MKKQAIDTINFRAYKIYPKLPLKELGVLFKIDQPLNWKEYIVIEAQSIETVLKVHSESKMVYLFQYGCICFVNFGENEVYTFLRYIESIIGIIDYSLFSKFNDQHILKLEGAGKCRPWKTSDECLPYREFYPHVFCIVLAKSVELYKLETDMELLFDSAESFINAMKRGKLNTSKRKLTRMTSKVLRFEHHIVNDIHIFERSIDEHESTEIREFYDKLSAYYELDDRCKAVQNKMDDLRRLFKSFYSLSYKQTETKLYWLEIFLLALFPLFYAIGYIPHIHDIGRWIRIIIGI